MKSAVILFVYITFVLVFAHCQDYRDDGLLDDNYKTTYFTLNGQVTNDSQITLSNNPIRVAILWETVEGGVENEDREIYFVAQEMDITPSFPFSFQMNVNVLPMAEAVVELEDGSKGAFGILVVYEDRNNNGQLDMIRNDATTAIDQVIGYAENYYILFVEKIGTGEGLNEDLAGVTVGYNILQEVPQPCDEDEWFCFPELQILPLATTIIVPLSADSSLNRFLCEDGASYHVTGSASTDNSEAPQGARIACLDAYSYQWDLVVSTTGTICDIHEERIGGHYELVGDNFPPDWPCLGY